MKNIYNTGLISLVVIGTITHATAQVAPSRLAIPDPSHVLAPDIAKPHAASPSPILEGVKLPTSHASRLQFRAVRIEGNTRVPVTEIVDIFAPLKGRAISADDLKAALDRANVLFNDNGLPLGRAFIPAQKISDGVLIVHVLEGYVSHVTVRADSPATKRLVERFTRSLLTERPLTRAGLTRAMLNLQDVPGITLGSQFQNMDPASGATELVISATIRPVTMGLTMDNRSNLSGLPVQPYLVTNANNLLGLGEQISAIVLLSPRQKDYAFYDLAGGIPIGSDGLTAGLDASWAQALDTVDLRPFAVTSRNLQAAAKARYPIIRALDESLSVQGRVYFTNANYGVSGYSGTLAHDRYLAGEAELDYARVLTSELGISGSLRATQGLQDFTGDPHTRTDTAGNFFKIRLDTKVAWNPVPNLTMTASAAAQFSLNSLYASEEIAFGGLAYGRAFEPSEISGDSGFGVSFQPEYRIALSGNYAVSPYLAVDYSRAYNRVIELQPNGILVSAGFGAKIDLAGLATLTIEADKPINRTPIDRTDRSLRYYGGIEVGMDKAVSLIEEIL